MSDTVDELMCPHTNVEIQVVAPLYGEDANEAKKKKSKMHIHLSSTALASMVLAADGVCGGVILMHIFGRWEGGAGLPIETRVRGTTCCRYPDRPQGTGDSNLKPSFYTVTLTNENMCHSIWFICIIAFIIR